MSESGRNVPVRNHIFRTFVNNRLVHICQKEKFVLVANIFKCKLVIKIFPVNPIEVVNPIKLYESI